MGASSVHERFVLPTSALGKCALIVVTQKLHLDQMCERSTLKDTNMITHSLLQILGNYSLRIARVDDSDDIRDLT